MMPGSLVAGSSGLGQHQHPMHQMYSEFGGSLRENDGMMYPPQQQQQLGPVSEQQARGGGGSAVHTVDPAMMMLQGAWQQQQPAQPTQSVAQSFMSLPSDFLNGGSDFLEKLDVERGSHAEELFSAGNLLHHLQQQGGLGGLAEMLQPDDAHMTL